MTRPADFACKSSIHAKRKHVYARGRPDAIPCASRSALLHVKMANETSTRTKEKCNEYDCQAQIPERRGRRRPWCRIRVRRCPCDRAVDARDQVAADDELAQIAR